MKLVKQELTERIIGCGVAVHRSLGPGFLEVVYQNAMCIELRERRLAFDVQSEVLVRYRDRVVGRHRPDLVVAGQVIAELKAMKEIIPVHLAIVRSYLRATRLRVGLVLNFGGAVVQVRRVVL